MTHFRRMAFVFRSWAGRVAWFPTLSESEPKPGRAGWFWRGCPGEAALPPLPCLLDLGASVSSPRQSRLLLPFPAQHNFQVVQWWHLCTQTRKTGRCAAGGNRHTKKTRDQKRGQWDVFKIKPCGQKRGKGNRPSSYWCWSPRGKQRDACSPTFKIPIAFSKEGAMVRGQISFLFLKGKEKPDEWAQPPPIRLQEASAPKPINKRCALQC